MTRKTAFFEGLTWFKFNNIRLALGMNFKFYNSVAKGLKIKIRNFFELNPTFAEVTGKKLVGGAFLPHPILNRVNDRPDTTKAILKQYQPKQYHSFQNLGKLQILTLHPFSKERK